LSQNHFLKKILDARENTSAFWSTAQDKTKTLLLFVHGFGGSSVGTWENLPELLLSNPKFSDCDLVFYGYDGLYKQVPISGEQFRGFLSNLSTQPAEVCNSTLQDGHRSSTFKYNKIIIIAHSLGAVVARRALLNAHNNGEDWLDSIHLLLFAPAHMGTTNVQSLVSTCVSAIPGLGKILAAIGRWRYLAADDLLPGSTTLTNLERDTIQALENGGCQYLIAHKVLFGELENIVQTARFCQDPTLTPVENKGHVDICKPESDYLIPVQALQELV